jgi:shikimate dehydrogenase
MNGQFSSDPIDARTRYCAVYGHPIKHSASPAMQNAGIAMLGLNWRYLAFEVRPDELESAIAGAAAMHFIGLNLTVPHKLLAYEMVDVLDESAKAWGAVNTIRFEGRNEAGEWRPLGEFSDAPSETRSHGFNTDAEAITRSLQEDLGFNVRGGKVLLLGAGGAGRTAALKIAADGAEELFLVNRTESKARELAEEIRTRFPKTKVTVGYPSHAVDLLLNATSVGLSGSESPLHESKFSIAKAGAVYDMIYRPAETPLLISAKAAGCRNSNGIGMLLSQGTAALEIWTGQPAPVEVMRNALVKEVYG